MTGTQTTNADFETDQGIDSDQRVLTGLTVDCDAAGDRFTTRIRGVVRGFFRAFINGCVGVY